MNRGYFDFIAQDKAYSGAEKHWIVSLEWSKCYWYDLVVESPDFVETKKEITCHLKELRRQVEQELEKRFIYFFASRPKRLSKKTYVNRKSSNGHFIRRLVILLLYDFFIEEARVTV